MTIVTVVRRVPPPIFGVVGLVQDRSVEAFEQTLDWLETTGTVVDRIDPVQDPEALARVPEGCALLAKEGTPCLPLVLVNDSVVSRGTTPDRAMLVRLVGLSRHALAGAIVQQLAAVAAAAAMGDDAQIRTDSARARAIGIAEADIAMAADVGSRRRAARYTQPAA